MRTKKDFEKIASDFYNSTNGKMESAFLNAVFDFMERHKFQHNVYNILYESDDVRIVFLTDHILNNDGFIFIEFIAEGSKSYLMIENKNTFIQNLLAFINRR